MVGAKNEVFENKGVRLNEIESMELTPKK